MTGRYNHSEAKRKHRTEARAAARRTGVRPSVSRLVIERRSIPEPNTGCWLWTGTLDGRRKTKGIGYGCVERLGVWIRAHIASYEAHFGPIPGGLLVCHRCDTPACVNPDHLFLGTHLDNVRDREAKGRGADVRGDANPFAKLTGAGVLDIRRRRALGESTRELANAFGVCRSTIQLVVARKIWKHVGPATPTEAHQ